MRQPECLTSLVDQGIIQEVVRPLMSGKEAQIYLVVSGGQLRVAKVYKEAQNRAFRQRVEYTEGRGGRNTRTQRAKNRHSRFGRAQDEASWRSAEVDIIHRLRAAGVPVPEPYSYVDGVLVMELITDANGDPAPRLADVTLGREEAREVYATLLSAVVKMLNAGVVHGDLSEFNVLMGRNGPVIIDFPQSVDPAHNRNARGLLIRDVDNLSHVPARFGSGPRRLPYGQELWELYERSELTADTRLTGRYQPPQRKADDAEVLYEIGAAARDAEKRRDQQGQGSGRRRRRSRSAPQAGTAGANKSLPVRGTAAAAGANKPQPVGGTAAAAGANKPLPVRGTAGTAGANKPLPVRRTARPARANKSTPARDAARPARTNKSTPARGTARPSRANKPRPATGTARPVRGAAKPDRAKAARPVQGAPAHAAPTHAAPATAAGNGNRPDPQTKQSPPGIRRRRRRRRRRVSAAGKNTD